LQDTSPTAYDLARVLRRFSPTGPPLDQVRIQFSCVTIILIRRCPVSLGLGNPGSSHGALRIGRLGFSFHDNTAAFKAIVDGYDKWASCLIQHNYMDIENQAGTEGLRYAVAHGLPVAIMEPLLGGCLARPPAEAQVVFAEAQRDWTPAEWALHWLWDQPEVSVVLSGMGSAEQVEANVRAANESAVGSLTPEDHAAIDRAREAFRARIPVPCTGCGYCLPCPHGVKIPSIIEIYNDNAMYGNTDRQRLVYNWRLGPEEQAASCEACGECEEKCPQDIAICELMPKIHEALTGS